MISVFEIKEEISTARLLYFLINRFAPLSKVGRMITSFISQIRIPTKQSDLNFVTLQLQFNSFYVERESFVMHERGYR
jgi:hypothetical protein